MRFWKDKWCGETLSCVSLPSLFALVDLKEAWVEDIWDSLGRGGGAMLI